MNTPSFLLNWKRLLKDKRFRLSLLLSIVMWIPGLAIYKLSINHVDQLQGTAVKDLILNFLPVMDLQYLYIYGISVLMVTFIFYLLFIKPSLLPFSLSFLALVFITRACFISLTHLAPPEGFTIASFAATYNIWPLSHMLHANDLFFSGHVGYPFAAALVMLHYNKKLFAFFLIGSFIMAFTVLVMRAHYSIDVGAAFFIVYGLYKMTQGIYKKMNVSLPENKITKRLSERR